MSIQDAYNSWASQYDTNHNRTRDAEAIALRQLLKDRSFTHCLEMGCGTGKNTEWLMTIADRVTAVDFSAEMLEQARKKIDSDKVNFVRADIMQPWTFAGHKYDLITFSLVLEHIERLDDILQNVKEVASPGATLYIGELHPFKQYSGSKARFDTAEGTKVVTCYNHHVSDFTRAAGLAGFSMVRLEEYFDEGDRTNLPRVLAMVFEKG